MKVPAMNRANGNFSDTSLERLHSVSISYVLSLSDTVVSLCFLELGEPLCDATCYLFDSMCITLLSNARPSQMLKGHGMPTKQSL